MSVELEGGCRVTTLREGEPELAGAARIWRHFESKLSLRILEIDGEHTFANAAHDEVLYDLATDEGIYIPAGTPLTLNDRATYVSSLTPATRGADVSSAQPRGSAAFAAHERTRRPLPNRKIERLKLAGQPRQKTADRWYAELVQAEVTQFVGSIPPGRAPDHFHLYEEVICILAGAGIMHAGESSAPVSKGSCIFLPIRQRHCLENTGSGELRLLGVFYPAGSPAVRYTA